VKSPNFHADLREPRIGCMVHYSAGDFNSTVSWVCDPTSKVSYHVVIAGDGAAVQLVPWDARAWHAGLCKPSRDSRSYEDANSAFYGIALSGGPAFGRPTDAQEQTLNSILWDRFAEHHWPVSEWWRIVGHDTEAVHTKASAPEHPKLWGKRGRKADPTGDSHGYGPLNPWLSLEGVRAALAATEQ
jgi:N-acetyl-anhydromuramyl-L-alanine amidase AmpD